MIEKSLCDKRLDHLMPVFIWYFRQLMPLQSRFDGKKAAENILYNNTLSHLMPGTFSAFLDRQPSPLGGVVTITGVDRSRCISKDDPQEIVD